MIFLMMHSPSPIRHAFYETFLVCHQLVAAMAVIAIYYHIKIDQLPQMKYFIWVIFLWAFDRAARLARIFYRNIGSAMTRVTVEALPGDACRVTIACTRPWKFKPGAHLYLYLPSLSFWQSHPFSIAWSQDMPVEGLALSEKLPSFERDMEVPTTKTMSLIIHKKKGMTNSLYNKASKAPNRTITVRGLVEGPYGGLHSFDSYGTVVLVAGGVGITHMISYIKPLIEGYNEGRIATRKIVLIWTVRERGTVLHFFLTLGDNILTAY
jgi:predicted ferric reductase